MDCSFGLIGAFSWVAGFAFIRYDSVPSLLATPFPQEGCKKELRRAIAAPADGVRGKGKVQIPDVSWNHEPGRAGQSGSGAPSGRALPPRTAGSRRGQLEP